MAAYKSILPVLPNVCYVDSFIMKLKLQIRYKSAKVAKIRNHKMLSEKFLSRLIEDDLCRPMRIQFIEWENRISNRITE